MRRVRNTTDWFKLLNFQHTTSNFCAEARHARTTTVRCAGIIRTEARHARTTTMRRARNVTLLRVQHITFNLFNRGMWFKLSKFRHTTSIILCTPWYKLLNFGTPRNYLCTGSIGNADQRHLRHGSRCQPWYIHPSGVKLQVGTSR